MKKTLKSLFETDVLHLVVLCLIFALALVVSGCSVTKVNYERDEKGVVSYRLYRNDHWLKTSGTGISGGMTKDGKFEFSAEGLERSPSEEFNRTMMTYTSAFIQLAQIAAFFPSARLLARPEKGRLLVKLEHAAQGKLGHGPAVDAPGVTHPDIPCTGSFQIHPVKPGGGKLDEAQSGEGRDGMV